MLRNFKDTKCKWGFITLCSRCVEKVKARPRLISYRSIKIDTEIKDMPKMELCEICGGLR